MSALRKGKYRHYKGKLYEVIDVACHSETLEQLVVYRTLYVNENGEQTVWVRPLRMFTEEIIVNGERTPRFRFEE